MLPVQGSIYYFHKRKSVQKVCEHLPGAWPDHMGADDKKMVAWEGGPFTPCGQRGGWKEQLEPLVWLEEGGLSPGRAGVCRQMWAWG